MKRIFKTIAGTVGAASICLSMNVKADVVNESGITWDSTEQGGLSASVQFQQWYSNGNYGVSNGVPIITSSSSQDLAVGSGVLTGIGKFTLFSDGRAQGPFGFGGGTSFCTAGPGACELTFAFGGLVPLSLDEFDSSNAWLNVYYDDASLDGTGFGDISSTSNTRFSEAQDGNLWASFSFDNFVFESLSGDFTDGEGYAELSVTGGLAFETLNFAEGSPDFQFVTASQFENNSNNYSTTGDGNITSVSAPSTVAFFGLALMGLGAVSRRKLR